MMSESNPPTAEEVVDQNPTEVVQKSKKQVDFDENEQVKSTETSKDSAPKYAVETEVPEQKLETIEATTKEEPEVEESKEKESTNNSKEDKAVEPTDTSREEKGVESDTESFLELHLHDVDGFVKSRSRAATVLSETMPIEEESTDQMQQIANGGTDDATEKIKLYQLPPYGSIPSFSPHSLRVETFLRFKKLPYESQASFKFSEKGKTPWISYKGVAKTDAKFILDYLSKEFELSDDLSAKNMAYGTLVNRMLDTSLMDAVQHHRWVDSFSTFKRMHLERKGVKHQFALKVLQRRIKASLHNRYVNAETVYVSAERDLSALSVFLGENDFIMGSAPTSFDCAVFGYLANILWSGLESPMSKWIEEKGTNLVAYCERMKALFWPDWNELVHAKTCVEAKPDVDDTEKPVEEAVETSDGKDGETNKTTTVPVRRFSFKKKFKMPSLKRLSLVKEDSEKGKHSNGTAQTTNDDGLTEINLND